MFQRHTLNWFGVSIHSAVVYHYISDGDQRIYHWQKLNVPLSNYCDLLWANFVLKKISYLFFLMNTGYGMIWIGHWIGYMV